MTRLVGLLLRDMVLTRDEVAGLMEGLSNSGSVATGTTKLGDWLGGQGESLGLKFVSGLPRQLRLTGHPRY